MKKLLHLFVRAFAAGVKVGIGGFLLMMATAIGMAAWHHWGEEVQDATKNAVAPWRHLQDQ